MQFRETTLYIKFCVFLIIIDEEVKLGNIYVKFKFNPAE